MHTTASILNSKYTKSKRSDGFVCTVFWFGWKKIGYFICLKVSWSENFHDWSTLFLNKAEDDDDHDDDDDYHDDDGNDDDDDDDDLHQNQAWLVPHTPPSSSEESPQPVRHVPHFLCDW